MKSNKEFHFYIWQTTNNPKYKITSQLFKYELEDYYKLDWYIDKIYSKKYINKILKTFKFNCFLFIDFILIQLFSIIKKLKKKKLVVNLEVNNFEVMDRVSKFSKFDFNSFYCYFNMFDFKNRYISILIKNTIIESKFMFRLVQFACIYFVLTLAFISSYIDYFLYLYIVFFISKDVAYLIHKADLSKKQNLVKKLTS